MTSVRSRPSRALVLLLGALLLGSVAGCAPKPTVDQVDVPSWSATALPADPQAVLSGSGKLLKRDDAVTNQGTVTAANYTLTMTCQGKGKVYFELLSAGRGVGDGTSACNGNKDRVDVTLPGGVLTVKVSSVDVPAIFAFSLARKG